MLLGRSIGKASDRITIYACEATFRETVGLKCEGTVASLY
jgi:hypothetical protein